MQSASCIVFVATAWGPREGGVNAFNEDLVIAVRRILPSKYRIVCVVEHCTSEEMKAAENAKVELIPFAKKSSGRYLNAGAAQAVLVALAGNGISHDSIVWWIGHDVVSGITALTLALHEPKAPLAIIHHMDFRQYSHLKTPNGDTHEAINEQLEGLAANADQMFGVGPLLTRSASQRRIEAGRSEAIELTPGLARIEPPKGSPIQFSAITLGMLDEKSKRTKLAHLAVAAFAWMYALVEKEDSCKAKMTLAGIREDKKKDQAKAAYQLAEEWAARAISSRAGTIPITLTGFTTNREKLFKRLKEQSACLMLSWHEGFGLVGWEAIAARVPLITSRNSGLYQCLEERVLDGLVYGVDIHGADSGGELTPDDVQNVATRLNHIRKYPVKARIRAQRLFEALLSDSKKPAVWSATARDFSDALGLERSQAMTELHIRAEVAERLHGRRKALRTKLLSGLLEEAPVVYDILDLGIHRVLRGDYLNSKVAWRQPYEAKWQQVFAARCREFIQDLTGLDCSEVDEDKPEPTQHQYGYLCTKLKYSDKARDKGVHTLLEVMFDREERRHEITFIHFGEVREFALVCARGSVPEEVLKGVPDLTFDTYDQVIDLLARTKVKVKGAEDNGSLQVCTYSDTAVDYLFNDAVTDGLMLVEKRVSMPTIESLGWWFANSYHRGVVACDIGLAEQLKHHLEAIDCPARVMYARAPYPEPVNVGLACRNDDALWLEICRKALLECVRANDRAIVSSLEETVQLGNDIGVSLDFSRLEKEA